jgi:hypothetical protein
MSQGQAAYILCCESIATGRIVHSPLRLSRWLGLLDRAMVDDMAHQNAVISKDGAPRGAGTAGDAVGVAATAPGSRGNARSNKFAGDAALMA